MSAKNLTRKNFDYVWRRLDSISRHYGQYDKDMDRCLGAKLLSDPLLSAYATIFSFHSCISVYKPEEWVERVCLLQQVLFDTYMYRDLLALK